MIRSDSSTRFVSAASSDLAVIGLGRGPGTVAIDDKTVWTLAEPGSQVWSAAERDDVEATYYVASSATFVALLDAATPTARIGVDRLAEFRAACSMLAGEAVDVVSIEGQGGSPPQMTIAVRSPQGHSFDLSVVVYGSTDRHWPPGVRRVQGSELAAVEAVLAPLRRATS